MANRLRSKSYRLTYALRVGAHRSNRFIMEDATQFEYELILLLEFIGRRIASERNDRRLSQADLAELIKTKQSFISRIERGGTDIKASTLLKLATVFRITPESLLPDQGQFVDHALRMGGYAKNRKGRGLLERLKGIDIEKTDVLKLFS